MDAATSHLNAQACSAASPALEDQGLQDKDKKEPVGPIVPTPSRETHPQGGVLWAAQGHRSMGEDLMEELGSEKGCLVRQTGKFSESKLKKGCDQPLECLKRIPGQTFNPVPHPARRETGLWSPGGNCDTILKLSTPKLPPTHHLVLMRRKGPTDWLPASSSAHHCSFPELQWSPARPQVWWAG